MKEVRAYLAEHRITPGARFFPRPDECAEWIERRLEAAAHTRQMQRQAEAWKRKVAEFWAWAEQWMEDTGNDEEELSRRFPAFRGTKPPKNDAWGTPGETQHISSVRVHN